MMYTVSPPSPASVAASPVSETKLEATFRLSDHATKHETEGVANLNDENSSSQSTISNDAGRRSNSDRRTNCDHLRNSIRNRTSTYHTSNKQSVVINIGHSLMVSQYCWVTITVLVLGMISTPSCRPMVGAFAPSTSFSGISISLISSRAKQSSSSSASSSTVMMKSIPNIAFGQNDGRIWSSASGSQNFRNSRTSTERMNTRSSYNTRLQVAKSGGLMIRTESEYEETVLSTDSNRPVLVFFTAPWCGPCRLTVPVVKDILRQYTGQIDVVEICTDDLAQVAEHAGVVSIPTIQFYYKGSALESHSIVGCVAKGVLSSACAAVLEEVQNE